MDSERGVWSAYAAGFAENRPFLTWWSVDKTRGVIRYDLSRSAFLGLSRQAVTALRRLGIQAADRIAFGFGQNHYLDLVFRLAAQWLGAVPVTLNWEADPSVRCSYKIGLTDAKLLLLEGAFAEEHQLALAERHPDLPTLKVDEWLKNPDEPWLEPPLALSPDTEKLIIFTSGTTGNPKGVSHSYAGYDANAATFTDFFRVWGQPFTAVVTGPLHHANATAISDWCLRHPSARLHLIARYTTAYWSILAQLAASVEGLLLAPVVSRHFDFLASLVEKNELPLPWHQLAPALERTTFLIGSAPVGPTTVRRILEFCRRLPVVRFGSSETCLQVMGIPPEMPDSQRLHAFERGWARPERVGYYVGRPHRGHTEVRVVASIVRGQPGFMEEVGEGQPGFLITRGKNLMREYVGEPEATARVLVDGWYLGLEDIGFYLENTFDQARDFYWMSRESTLLIKGGANYAYDQINSELSAYLHDQLGVPEGTIDVAVVGLKVDSEHEDLCCATVFLHEGDHAAQRQKIEALLTGPAAKNLSKGARPDRVRFGPIPRNFKGAVVVADLRKGFSK